MYWKLTCEDAASANAGAADGRFVLHRHTDAEGPHLDLRIETGYYLTGWRIDGLSLEGEPWATEKRPHPAHWLEHAGDAVRESGGVYTWASQSADAAVRLIRDDRGAKRLRFTAAPGLPAQAVRAVRDALHAANAEPCDAARLITDGATARRRAIERLCGLGRELDGSAFDEPLWRRTLQPLTLDEIHAQLRAFEVRFDHVYPPQPVSQPEALPAWERDNRSGMALAIVRG